MRSTHVEPTDSPGRGSSPGGDFGHAEHGVKAHPFVEVFEQLVGVAVEQQRRFHRRTDGRRLDIRLEDRALGEPEVVAFVRHGKPDRPVQLEPVAARQFGGVAIPPMK